MEAARLVPLQRRPDAVGLRRNHQWKPTTAAAAAADQPISSQGPGARRFEPVGVAAAQLDQLFQRRRDGRSPAPGPEFRVGRTVKKKQQLDARRTKKRQEKKNKSIAAVQVRFAGRPHSIFTLGSKKFFFFQNIKRIVEPFASSGRPSKRA